jgi:hypothetical protein
MSLKSSLIERLCTEGILTGLSFDLLIPVGIVISADNPVTALLLGSVERLISLTQQSFGIGIAVR